MESWDRRAALHREPGLSDEDDPPDADACGSWKDERDRETDHDQDDAIETSALDVSAAWTV